MRLRSHLFVYATAILVLATAGTALAQTGSIQGCSERVAVRLQKIPVFVGMRRISLPIIPASAEIFESWRHPFCSLLLRLEFWRSTVSRQKVLRFETVRAGTART